MYSFIIFVIIIIFFFTLGDSLFLRVDFCCFDSIICIVSPGLDSHMFIVCLFVFMLLFYHHLYYFTRLFILTVLDFPYFIYSLVFIYSYYGVFINCIVLLVV